MPEFQLPNSLRGTSPLFNKVGIFNVSMDFLFLKISGTLFQLCSFT